MTLLVFAGTGSGSNTLTGTGGGAGYDNTGSGYNNPGSQYDNTNTGGGYDNTGSGYDNTGSGYNNSNSGTGSGYGSGSSDPGYESSGTPQATGTGTGTGAFNSSVPGTPSFMHHDARQDVLSTRNCSKALLKYKWPLWWGRTSSLIADVQQVEVCTSPVKIIHKVFLWTGVGGNTGTAHMSTGQKIASGKRLLLKCLEETSDSLLRLIET